jgi:flagellar basal-body rod protein FlgC
MFDAVETIASGIAAARLRVNTLAANIANAETTSTPEGGPYKARHVVQVAQDVPGTFSDALERMTLKRPMVSAVVEDSTEPRKVYEPGHPNADAQGYVAYPNINVVSTMTDLMSATRQYQSAVTAMDTLKDLREATGKIIA